MNDIYTSKRDKSVPKKKSNKLLFFVILILLILIATKKDPQFKDKIKKYVYESNISFSKINEIYKKYAGEVLPNSKKEEKPVFNEELSIIENKPYLDGVSLKLENELIASHKSGLVVFIGEGALIGSVLDKKLFLVCAKLGTNINYEEYIKS